jgi:hypothetical protein
MTNHNDDNLSNNGLECWVTPRLDLMTTPATDGTGKQFPFYKEFTNTVGPVIAGPS